MTQQTQLKGFDWAGELHKTMIHSLTTSFGLDFLLFEDKKGGNVDTTQKVREYQQELNKNGQSDIHVSDEIRSQLTSKGKNKEAYNSHSYHSNDSYITRGQQDKAGQKAGQLHDEYRGTKMSQYEKRQLDHIQSASEIHHDAARILSGSDGVTLANQDSNLSSTLAYINTKKSDMPIQEFVDKLPEMKKQKQNTIQKNKEQLANMPERTPEERHKKQQLKKQIQKAQEHLEALESIDTAAMLKKDQEARKAYNRQIDWNYYTSSKFFGSAAKDMGKQGAKMGARQAFGLLLAEVWFELKAEVPLIYRECRDNFQLKDFLNRVGQILKNICERVKSRFKEMLSLFKDGFISSLFSSISTTIWNAFQTIGGNAIKIIRESWNSIIQAVKLVFFNPNQLSLGELVKEVTRIVGAAASIAAGTVVNSAMLELLKFIPFDFIRDGLAAFVSALISGILTMGLSYFLDHSDMMQKVWAMLDSFKSKYQKILEHFQEINAELDRYLVELSKIEFNMNALEFGQFADALVVTNDEFQRSVILNAEILRRNIKLPFEAGDTESVRGWLGTLSK